MYQFTFVLIPIAFTLVSNSFGPVRAFETANVNVSQPQSNAALDTTLAYYKLPGKNADSQFLTHAFIPVACGANLSVHYTEPSVYGSLTGTPQKPVLLLTHGFPESSYMWRYATQALSERVPLFALDVSIVFYFASGADLRNSNQGTGSRRPAVPARIS